MKKLITLSMALVALALLSCTPKRNSSDKTDLVGMQSGTCRGYCPHYKLLFRNDGSFEYEGLRFTEKTGVITSNLTADELKSLKATVKAVNLWQYPERIPSNIADIPMSTLTVYQGEKQHSVTGAIERDKSIVALEEMMKNLAEAHGINVRKSMDPNALPENSKEVIVKLNADINAGNWVMQFQEIKLRLVKRVSAENMWVIAYNPKEIAEDQLISYLKSVEGVVSVQANTAAKDRN